MTTHTAHPTLVARCPWDPTVYRWECPCGAMGVWSTDREKVDRLGLEHEADPDRYWIGYAKGLEYPISGRTERPPVLPSLAPIEPYRIGTPWWERFLLGPWRLWRAGYRREILRHVRTARRSRDRWRRCWQAEWEGCQRAPRAWTRWGVLRKARRWQGLW